MPFQELEKNEYRVNSFRSIVPVKRDVAGNSRGRIFLHGGLVSNNIRCNAIQSLVLLLLPHNFLFNVNNIIDIICS